MDGVLCHWPGKDKGENFGQESRNEHDAAAKNILLFLRSPSKKYWCSFPATHPAPPREGISSVTPMTKLQDDPLWYKDAIIYQLHVKAFNDSNGDGVGDFRGLLEKLDYLE